MPTPLTADTIATAPKVLLHDHLDGGLRPATLVELAEQDGYDGLPTTVVPDLARWFSESAYSGSLERYLETFVHTTAVMQTRESLIRVASECSQVLDAFRGHPDQRLAGLHHRGGVHECLQVALQRTGVGGLGEPPRQVRDDRGRQAVVAVLLGEFHQRRRA